MTNPEQDIPTEGVKLEPAGYRWERYNSLTGYSWVEYGAELPAQVDKFDRIREQLPLVSGPQAAKRIEEMEAELQEARELAFEEHGNVIRAEARALKAERQRDEAVGALERITGAGRTWSRAPHNLTTCRDIALSVLTSIREG